MKKSIFTLLVLLTYISAFTQNINPPANTVGGEYMVERTECISNDQRAKIKTMLKMNIEGLMREGKIKSAADAKVASPKFKWPLVQVAAYDYKYNYGISNFVDHDATYPNHVQDYNCGTRTYDNSGGYNHAGTDIFLWPFSWLQMQRKQVKIVAAAAGVIVGKSDGNFDKSCSFNNNNWNAVYVRHADGSVAWYGHMKLNSLTTKKVGDSVKVGEKLGFVGSSGNSTGPHLHFEVYDAGNHLVDPWKGPCNNIAASWWSAQKPYYESKLNTILTQSGAPVFPSCPNTETTNESSQFKPGSVIYFASYYHDQQAGQVTKYKVTRPDKSVYAQWTGASSTYYTASYWYSWYTLPANAPTGTWKYTAIFQGDTLTRTFTVSNTLIAKNAPPDVEQHTVDFFLSPNPANDNLRITTTYSTKVLNYKIFDMNGKLVREGILHSNKNNIAIAGLQKGMYCVSLISNDGSKSSIKKFIKL